MEFFVELAPAVDFERLAWRGDDLGPIVLEVHRALTATSDERLRKALGNVAELAVMAALNAPGREPTHVALVSDSYGYDIEYRLVGDVHRLEVKASVQATAGRFIISRNEVEVASSPPGGLIIAGTGGPPYCAGCCLANADNLLELSRP